MHASSLATLVRDGTLDAELAALLDLLVEARVPVVVAGSSGGQAQAIRDAMSGSLPTGVVPIVLTGPDEDFAWMPEAVELGWRREGPPTNAHLRATAAATALVADLDGSPGGTWGERARIAIRALAVGYDMLATAAGVRLEGVLERLSTPPVGATEDELARLGVVLILDEAGHRVAAAHYLRPVSRDAHGHVQRLGPAVIATWDAAAGRFEHFAWGITAELAERVGMTPVQLEREQAIRAESIATLAASPERLTPRARGATLAVRARNADPGASRAPSTAEARPAKRSALGDPGRLGSAGSVRGCGGCPVAPQLAGLTGRTEGLSRSRSGRSASTSIETGSSFSRGRPRR